MNTTLEQVTLAQVAIVLAAILAAIKPAKALLSSIRKGVHIFDQATAFFDEVNGDEATGRLPLVQKLDETAALVNEIHHQVYPNNGSSLFDEVKGMKSQIAGVQGQVDAVQEAQSSQLAAKLTQAAAMEQQAQGLQGQAAAIADLSKRIDSFAPQRNP